MSEFDEWINKNGFNFRPEKYYGYKSIYEAGQKSQQAKIDNLQKENDRLNTSYKNVKLQFENKQIDCDRSDRKIDELQAMVDSALNTLCKLQYSSGERIYNDVGGILKGNKDE